MTGTTLTSVSMVQSILTVLPLKVVMICQHYLCSVFSFFSQAPSRSKADSTMQVPPSKKSSKTDRATSTTSSEPLGTSSHVSAAETPPSKITGPPSQRPLIKIASTSSTTGPDCRTRGQRAAVLAFPRLPQALVRLPRPPLITAFLHPRPAFTRLIHRILARLLQTAKDGVNAEIRL